MSNGTDSATRQPEAQDWVERHLPQGYSWAKDPIRILLLAGPMLISVVVCALLVDHFFIKSEFTWKLWLAGIAGTVCVILLSLMWLVVFQGLRAGRASDESTQRAQTTVAYLKQLLHPDNETGPLADFFRRAQLLANPGDGESPLAAIFRQPDGTLPASVEEARKHVGEATRLLDKVDGNIGAFTEWGDDWREKADAALEALKVAYFKKRGLLMEPAEYVGVLNRARANWRTPQAQVNLCGTMAGFSFLLPSALEKHACSLGAGFRRLNLLAVDLKQLKQDEEPQFWYSTYLAADTLRRLCECKNVLDALATGHTMLVEVRYVDHDLLAAVIEVPKTSITVLQSLDSTSFLDILTKVGAPPAEVRPQLGFRFDDVPGERDEYDRYSASLQNLWVSFAARPEFWVLHDFDDGSIVKVWNPRWTAKLDAPEKVAAKPMSGPKGFCSDDDWARLPAERNEPDFLNAAATASLSIPRAKAAEFFSSLMSGARSRHAGIQSIEKCFADKPGVLAKLRERTCRCAAPHKEP